MSLWFSSPAPANSSPADSRQVGFGQVKALGPSFMMGGSEETSPMSSAAGGITQNFSSRTSISSNISNDFNFDGPNFYNNSLTFQNNNINNILQNFVINNLFQQLMGNTTDPLGGGTSFSCSDLGACGGTNTSITMLTSAALNSSGLVFTRRTLTFNGYGLLTSDTATTDTTVSTVACS